MAERHIAMILEYEPEERIRCLRLWQKIKQEGSEMERNGNCTRASLCRHHPDALQAFEERRLAERREIQGAPIDTTETGPSSNSPATGPSRDNPSTNQGSAPSSETAVGDAVTQAQSNPPVQAVVTTLAESISNF